MLNLFAFWLGGMTAGVVAGPTTLLVLHDALPGLVHTLAATMARFTGGHIQVVQVVVGVLALR